MPRLGPISCITIACAELDRSTDLYRRYLGYQVVESGVVPAALAQLWKKSALQGRRYALALPEGQGRSYFRFIESQAEPSYVPFRHMGWNAAELMVQNTDACAERLANSPFRIIGQPANLSFSDNIRAMQVLGPSGESLYLTSFKEKMPIFDTPDANCFIDRSFIVIVGGPSVAALNDFYSVHLGVAKADVIPSVISVLSKAHGLPLNTRHDLAAMTLHGQSFIEADTMPAGTLPRPANGDELPAAISMVSFGVDALPDTGLAFLAAPAELAIAPYGGRRAAVCIGAGGELIELIEGD
jgi:catechol 2,3-dioxygenase-like lactoylglutathione lyase family enzyme